MSEFTYAASGVDVDIEERAATIMYEAARKTWKNRAGSLGEVVTVFDDFSGLRIIRAGELPKGTVMNIGFDGTGTKAMLAERAGKYDTIAYDLFAMVCDDAVVRGAEPVVVGSILDINTLGQDDSRIPIIEQLAKGYVAAADDAGVAIVNGEIAQLGSHVSGKSDPFAFSWGAGLVWFAHESRMFTGHEIKVGDHIVGLREEGLRSNGISLVRKVLGAKYGEDWGGQKLGGTTLIEAALHPSRIYSKAVVEMLGGWSLDQEPAAVVHGVSHITGSGLPGKLGRILKASGLGADIAKPFVPGDLMLHCQQLGSISDEEAYRTWNMGQGMAVITPEPESVISVAEHHGIDAKIIGVVSDQSGIRIRSSGYFSGETPDLVFAD